VSASFEAFVDERYGALTAAMAPVPNPDGEPSIDTLKALAAKQPGSYRVQITLGQQLVQAGELEAATVPLQRAAALAPMARGDDSPNALLADIAEKRQDNDAAMDAWLRLIEADHDNVDAAQRLLVTARAVSNVAAETVALKLIASVDPFDATAHALLGRQALARKDYDVALIELQAALALGPPNVAEAQADVAEAYLGLGRKDDARKAALKALEFAPTFARAQDILLAAIGGGL
jgi:tetratricopeptide (TPR) repeat protein